MAEKIATESNEDLLVNDEAMNLIHEHARDLFKLKITLPLGHPALKKVHTNQFCFFDIPELFQMGYWETIAQVYNSAITRYSGYDYVPGRWYIESVNTSVDAKGKAEIQLDLNAFPTSLKSFQEDMRSFEKAYSDAVDNGNSDSSNDTSSSTSTTTTSTGSTNTTISNLAAEICKGLSTEEEKASAIYYWVDKNIKFSFYYNDRYSSAKVVEIKKANCVDTAQLIYDLCSAQNVRCEIIKGKYHFSTGTYRHWWNKIPYNGQMTFADTGRNNPNPIGSHGTKGNHIVYGNLLMKNY